MIEQLQSSSSLHKPSSSSFSSFQTVQFPSRPSSSYFKISLDPKCQRNSRSSSPPKSSSPTEVAKTDSPPNNKRHLRRPRHPHDQPDENYMFRVFTPGEYDAMRTADNNWRVTTSSDISGSWDGIPFAAEEYRSGKQPKFMGRPPKTKLPRQSTSILDLRTQPKTNKSSKPQPPQSSSSQKLRFAPPCGIETQQIKSENLTSLIPQSGPFTVTSLIDPVTHAYIRNPGGAALWTCTTKANEYRLMINVARISDIKATMTSLLCFLQEGWDGLAVFQVNCEPSSVSPRLIYDKAWDIDENITRPSTLSRQPIILINKDILHKYTIRAYKEDAYDSGLNGPREQVSWVPEWYSISLTVLPFVYPIMSSSTMESDVALNMLVDAVVRQYMICGNGYHPLLYRPTVIEKLENLQDPLEDALICAIVAGWIRHTLMIHMPNRGIQTVDNIQPLEMYFRQKAWELFSEVFDETSYEALWILSIFMLGCTSERHVMYHYLGVRFINEMNLYETVHDRKLHEQTTDPEERFILEMNRRAWWDWYHNNDCCKLMPWVDFNDFNNLMMPQRVPDEKIEDWANIEFHFHSKMVLRNIERKLADTIEANPEEALSQEEVTFFETQLSEWHNSQPDFLRIPDSENVVPSMWAVEINIRHNLTKMSLNRLFIQHHEEQDLIPKTTEMNPHTALVNCTQSCVLITDLLHILHIKHYCRPHIRTWQQVCGTLIDMIAMFADKTNHCDAQCISDARDALAKALWLFQQTDAFNRRVPGYVEYGEVVQEAMDRLNVERLLWKEEAAWAYDVGTNYNYIDHIYL
ncbi:hypothetical protein BGW37DRAFT_526358 [Umbelopsis sp. PMI_123]|nr:hypothetical protein BGW37DRAFT_526358 [Umbelopsis sp. PMI_123]